MVTLLIVSGLLVLHVAMFFSAGHALLHKHDSRSALGWVAVILLVPFAGLSLYWLFGIARVDSRAVRLMKQAAQQVMGGLVDLHGKSLLEEPSGSVPESVLPAELVYLARPGRHITGRALIGDNQLTPLHNGEAAYPVMLDAIGKARQSVYLSSFIFGYDDVGKRFAEALKEAAKRGCDVRVLMDGVGSFHPLAHWAKRLGNAQLSWFLPPSLFPPQLSINLRTHRKVLVCDGTIAFTGGMNISEHHLADLPRPDRVQDLHFRCVGPIARQLEVAFLMDWSFTTGSPARMPESAASSEALAARVPSESDTVSASASIHTTANASPRSSLCRILMDGPGNPQATILDLFCAQISTARQSVRIMSPYFLPPHPLATALTSAVLRGVEVSVILPGKNNHRLLDWAMRHHMPMLEERGVRILYQPPPFAHTKLLLIDGAYTLLGSANLDPRSLNLNFELVMEVLDPKLTEQLTAFYDEVKSRSAPAPERLPSLPVRLRNAASWIFSPYL